MFLHITFYLHGLILCIFQGLILCMFEIHCPIKHIISSAFCWLCQNTTVWVFICLVYVAILSQGAPLKELPQGCLKSHVQTTTSSCLQRDPTTFPSTTWPPSYAVLVKWSTTLRNSAPMPIWLSRPSHGDMTTRITATFTGTKLIGSTSSYSISVKKAVDYISWNMIFALGITKLMDSTWTSMVLQNMPRTLSQSSIW